MNKVLDPLLLKDTAPRSHVALVYLAVGLGLGIFVFGSDSTSG
ncbi:P10 [Pseudomonas phage phi2954]|uniref:p10 n=1 Tax=Pseudomonas phage phi2954 TaxID=593131 RepID=C0KIU0_9VIRU|nr:P10 [Pseudomonas phage phi2954]ACM91125.1 P10 [Pseudomonas phage phi2954]